MKNPCYGCVTPKRYPGCHDHCSERKEYVDKVLIPQKKYKDRYIYYGFDNWKYRNV